MIERHTGPIEVQPNTLRDQRVPNTFRSQSGPGSAGKHDLNRSGGQAAPRRPLAWPQLLVWASVALVVLAVLVTLYLLTRTP